jgi:Tol biopolymer transport system component
MSLTPGTRFGAYEILAPIGAGGMGEVYRARDTKLKRDVALKVLPEAFASDPARMARFQREAEVLASLNHPNIAAIYGVEGSALAMELVEGDSPEGPLAFDEAWRIASQIATALEYAHDKGVVHRDLKPANVKITPEGMVKLLDFGLAKAMTAQGEARPDAENSPTLTIGATEVGVILGTAAYMSPEQARGKQVDKRADIWSFGVVFYQLLTGERLFKGEDVSETLAHVLTKQPDFEKVPAKARRLLRECLERDPKQRLRDIGDAKRLIEDAPSASASSRSRFSWWGWAAGVLAAALVAVLVILWPRPAPLRPLMRLDVDLGPDAVAAGNIPTAISPDGTRIVFGMRGADGKQRLATRLLDQANTTLLGGTEGGFDPFFSPDGQWAGFFADGKMKKVSVQGGSPVTLCDAPDPHGASWGADGNIAAALAAVTGLVRVSAAGGTPQPITRVGDRGELNHYWPQILPSGSAVLFTASTTSVAFEDASLDVVSLNTGKTKTLLSGGYFGRYVPTGAAIGNLVYVHEGTLFGVPFDPVKLELKGTAAPLLGDVAGNPRTGAGAFDYSASGMFMYQTGKVTSQTWPIAWLNSSGKTQTLLGPSYYTTPRVSPDGERLAFRNGVGSGGAAKGDIFTYDLRRETLSRLTFTNQQNFFPIWTPDGKHIVFRSPSSSGGSDVKWIRSDGAGEPQILLETKFLASPSSFFPDGRRLVYRQLTQRNTFELWTLSLDLTDPDHPKPAQPEAFLQTPHNETGPAFSPDGKWIAYQSDESGKNEVYVRPFPGPGGKWQISTGGGQLPIWSRNGRELFFETLDNHIMVVDYAAGSDSFTLGKRRVWSEKQIGGVTGGGIQNYDLAPDGKRFVVFLPEAPAAQSGSLHVTFLLNFFDELRRRLPASGK